MPLAFNLKPAQMISDFMSIANRIKLARESTGKSQRDFAEIIGVSYRSVQEYENGKSIPGGKSLINYGDLGFNLNWILLGDGPMILNVKDSSLFFLQDDELLDSVIMALDIYLLEMRTVLPLKKKREFIKAIYNSVKDQESVPSAEMMTKTIVNMFGLAIA